MSGRHPFPASETLVNLAIASDAGFPGPLGLHVAAGCSTQLGPALGLIEQCNHLAREILFAARLEQHRRYAVLQQLAMAPDIGGYDEASLRHRFQRLERGDEIREAHGEPRIHEDIDEIVVAAYLIVRNSPREHDAIRDAQFRCLAAQVVLLVAAADQQQARVGTPLENPAHRRDEQAQSFVAIERADEAEHDAPVEAKAARELRVLGSLACELLDVDAIRQPLPGLRNLDEAKDAPSLSGMLGDAEDGVRDRPLQPAPREPERVFPWEVPTRGEFQWEVHYAPSYEKFFTLSEFDGWDQDVSGEVTWAPNERTQMRLSDRYVDYNRAVRFAQDVDVAEPGGDVQARLGRRGFKQNVAEGGISHRFAPHHSVSLSLRNVDNEGDPFATTGFADKNSVTSGSLGPGSPVTYAVIAADGSFVVTSRDIGQIWHTFDERRNRLVRDPVNLTEPVTAAAASMSVEVSLLYMKSPGIPSWGKYDTRSRSRTLRYGVMRAAASRRRNTMRP